MTRTPKMPPANASREAVALRKAAMAFTRNIGEPTDMNDTRGAKLNLELCKAALAYASAVRREVSPAAWVEVEITGRLP